MDIDIESTFFSSTNSDSVGVTCDGGKCFKCSPPDESSILQEEEFPVSARFLDQAEDYIDDDYSCGLYHKHDYIRGKCDPTRKLCEGDICIRCCYVRLAQADGSYVSEYILENVEKLIKMGLKCSAKLDGRPASTSPGEEIVCERGGSKVCFVCRR